ncbi:MAG: ribonuclease III [Clostridiales bacterium]|nr:ribonuclease III [Clostridiales bacterium]
MELSKVEAKINYTFKDKNLLERAFTLSSYNQDENNQTLEFFGDAILEFLVSERIYDQKKSEGQLTELRQAIVSDAALATVSKELGLDGFLIKSQNDSNNKKAVPSVYEALVAAIYLDGGMDEARKFVHSTLNFENIPQNENYKGQLQELLQGRGQKCPEYLAFEDGTAQKPHFVVKVAVEGKTFTGEAGNKKLAEQNAAREALEHLNQGDI